MVDTYGDGISQNNNPRIKKVDPVIKPKLGNNDNVKNDV
jgi:hypothetical protein